MRKLTDYNQDLQVMGYPIQGLSQPKLIEAEAWIGAIQVSEVP